MGLDLSFTQRGRYFADLVRELAGVTEEAFLEVCSDPFLLQFPFTRNPVGGDNKGATRSTSRLDAPDPEGLDGTLQMSLESVLAAAKGRKAAEGAKIHRVAFGAEPIVLGRSSKVDLILPESTVSNRHAEVQRDGTGFTIKDLGSQNGTYIDGRRIPANRPLRFRPDQSLWFASYRTIFITARKAYDVVAKYGQVTGA